MPVICGLRPLEFLSSVTPPTETLREAPQIASIISKAHSMF